MAANLASDRSTWKVAALACTDATCRISGICTCAQCLVFSHTSNDLIEAPSTVPLTLEMMEWALVPWNANELVPMWKAAGSSDTGCGPTDLWMDQLPLLRIGIACTFSERRCKMGSAASCSMAVWM